MRRSGEFPESECFLPRGNLLTASKLLDESEILAPRQLSGSSSVAYSPTGSINEPIIENYSDESEHNDDKDSMRSGESIIKNYIFDNTKYNPNTMKCIAFWRALKERPDLKPCPCDFSFESQSKLSTMENNSQISPKTESQSIGQSVTWYDALLELQKRKMDQVAFAATFQSCRLCERDEPYAKFKRKMGQNYSDSELNDDEDLTCLNCWTSYSIKREQAEAAEAARKKEEEETEEVTRIIFINSCVCKEADSKKCTCSTDLHNSRFSDVSDQDTFNPEIAYTTEDPTRICSESGEGDSLNVFPNAEIIRGCSRGKDYYDNLRKFQNLENPSWEGSNIIIEEAEVEQEAENCDCRSCDWSSCGDVEKKSIPRTEDELSNILSLADDETYFTTPPLPAENPSLGSSTSKPTISPAEMMDLQDKPGSCILSCVCNLCEPAIQNPLVEGTANRGKVTKKTPKKPKRVKLENFDKFFNQCEKCGIDCKCWKNKVDHAKQYLEDLKQMMKENETYDKACGTQDSEEDVSSTKSVNICIICGHKNCDCKYSHGRPSLYFQTIEFGSNQPQTTTFAKIFNEKLKVDASISSGLDLAKQPSGTSVNMEKLKTISLKHRVEKPIIKDCKNKIMVTPAQKAQSIIKNNVNLVLQKDLYGVPHVTRYPDKRPIVKPSEDEESYSSEPESSDDDTEVVHDLGPWYCTERPKEEEPEITYGRKL